MNGHRIACHRIACWRIRGDSARRIATSEWRDGEPDAELAREYARHGLVIEYAYVPAGVVAPRDSTEVAA